MWAHDEADRVLDAHGELARCDFFQALWGYLSISIDDALTSNHVLIRSLAMTDRRFGKRRLRELQVGDWEHPLIRQLFRLRCEVEGIACALHSSYPHRAKSRDSALGIDN